MNQLVRLLAPPASPDASLPNTGFGGRTAWRGRHIRILLGLAVIALAGVFLYNRFILLGSGRAVLGGTEVSLRAPIEGTLEATGILPGAIIDKGTRIGHIVNERVDDSHLAELRAAALGLEGDIGSTDWKLTGIEAQLSARGRTGAAFRRARLDQLRVGIAEAAATLANARARLEEAAQGVRRGLALLRRGDTTQLAFDTNRRDMAQAAEVFRAASERYQALLADQAAVTQGVYGTGTAQDLSASQQAGDRLTLERIELEAAKTVFQARLAAIRQEIAAEEARLALRREASIEVPQRSRLLQRLAETGEYVRQGQEIARLTECATPIATAELDQRTFTALRLGEPAAFLPAGTSESFPGTIIQLLPPALTTPDRSEAFRVLVSLRPNPRLEGCDMGRVGRLSFD